MDKLKLLFVLLLSVVMPIKVSKQIDVGVLPCAQNLM